MLPASACIAISSVINSPLKPISLRIRSIIAALWVAGASSNSVKRIWAVIPSVHRLTP